MIDLGYAFAIGNGYLKIHIIIQICQVTDAFLPQPLFYGGADLGVDIRFVDHAGSRDLELLDQFPKPL